MSAIGNLKAHYNFTNGDVENLRKLAPVMLKYTESFVAEFYYYVKNFDEADRYLKDEETVKKHQDALKVWWSRLFDGEYGDRYFAELERVGRTHVKINLPAHYVNASFHFVKSFASDVLAREINNAQERDYLGRSVDKILDVNLDIFTSSYIDEEKRFFLSKELESRLIQLTSRFSYGLNMILVVGLMLVGFIVIGLFIYDILHIQDGGIEKGLLTTLGSLLMLWVVIELLDTEIKHLRGGKFAIKVFVSVALVAVIRKILITSLKTEAVEAQVTLIAGVAVLGAVYWLIARVEK